MNELELKAGLADLQAQYKSKYEAFPIKKLADGSEARDIPANEVENLRKMADDMNDLGKRLDEAVRFRTVIDETETRLQREERTVAPQLARAPQAKGFVDSVLESRGAWGRGEKTTVQLPEFRAFMTTTAGFAPEVLREGVVIDAISRPLGLLDVVPVVPTSQTATRFMRATTRTSGTAAVPKGQTASADEATLVYEEVTSPVETITVYIPLSREQLEDEPTARALIGRDLPLAVRQTLDWQITNGDGTAPNLRGIANAVGRLTQARGTDTVYDAIMKGMTQVRTANGVGGRGGRFAQPNVLLMHPNDLQDLALTRTADGMYILQNPGDAPATRLWGVQIIDSLAVPENTAFVLDTSFMRVRLRSDAEIFVSDAHADYFVKRVTAFRCDLRAGFEIHSPQAICAVTGV